MERRGHSQVLLEFHYPARKHATLFLLLVSGNPIKNGSSKLQLNPNSTDIQRVAETFCEIFDTSSISLAIREFTASSAMRILDTRGV